MGRWRFHLAFFTAGVALFLLSTTAQSALCPADRIDDSIVVKHVYDGDTLQTTEGRSLRFIGINTPETAKKDRPGQPYGDEARQALERLLKKNKRLGLRYDREREDRYGRRLAHLFLENGDSLEGLLLREGYAMTLAVPPNLWNSDCYAQLEEEARQAKRGLWSLAAYQAKELSLLSKQADGFFIVHGRVSGIRSTEKSLRVEIDNQLAVDIPRKDREAFGDLHRLHGRRVELRAWIHPQRRANDSLRWFAQIRHPSALKQLDGIAR